MRRRREGPIHYVSKRFPKLTETFVVDEVLGLEAGGERVIVDSLEPPLEEPRHPGLERLRTEVRYVPEEPDEREVRRAQLRLALRRPRAWARVARRARAEGLWEEFRRAAVVARRTRAERARHVHTHFAYYCADVGGMAAALAGVPFTLTAHANDIWQERNAPHLARRLARAGAVITVSEHNRDHLRSVVGETPLHVVPLGVDLAGPAPAPADGPVLCVARLVPKKGVDTLVEAFARLARERPAVTLELIGEGHEEEDLRELADRLGVADRVSFLGPQPPRAVQEAYERCSLVALPSRVTPDGDRDGIPVVLLEALARALPVVASDVAGIPEVVHDDRTGLLVPPDDPDALAAAIAELLDDRERARRLGAAGRELVRATRSREMSIEALRDAFEAAWAR